MAEGGVGTEQIVGAEKSLQRGQDKLYKFGDESVQLSFKEFSPKEGENKDPRSAVIFMVGAPMRAKSEITWGQLDMMAEEFGAQTYSVDARPKGYFHSNAIDLEVGAIRTFIEELSRKGIQRVTLFGHSIGAVKAVKLAVALEQMDPQIKIDGLVLSNPMGFYPQEAKDLLFRRLPAESANQGKIQNPNVLHPTPLQGGWEAVKSIGSDIVTAGLGYPRLVKDQIGALTQVNPELAKVKSPVLILLSSLDKLSETVKIVPEDEIGEMMPSEESEEQLRGRIEGKWDSYQEFRESVNWGKLPEKTQQELRKEHDRLRQELSKFASKEEFVQDYLRKYRAQEIMFRRNAARRAYIKEKYLPEAEGVGVIEAQKYGHHLAFGAERPRHTSKVIVEIKRVLEKIKQDDEKKANPAA